MTLTLTYKPRNDALDKIIFPLHFQKFVRSLRRMGHSIRYLCAGEIGKLGRSHFHVIIFGNGKKPTCWRSADRVGKADKEIPHRKRSWWPSWPHGHIFPDIRVKEKALAYVVKYVCKEDDKPHWFTVSKKPLLGFEWFERKAADTIQRGLWPSTFNYLPPHGNKLKTYLMTGATRREYILALIRAKGLSTKDFLNLSGAQTQQSEWVLKAAWSAQKHIMRKEADEANPRGDASKFKEFMADLKRDLEKSKPQGIVAPKGPMTYSSYAGGWVPYVGEAKWRDVVDVLRIDGVVFRYNRKHPRLLIHPPGGWYNENQRYLASTVLAALNGELASPRRFGKQSRQIRYPEGQLQQPRDYRRVKQTAIPYLLEELLELSPETIKHLKPLQKRSVRNDQKERKAVLDAK